MKFLGINSVYEFVIMCFFVTLIFQNSVRVFHILPPRPTPSLGSFSASIIMCFFATHNIFQNNEGEFDITRHMEVSRPN